MIIAKVLTLRPSYLNAEWMVKPLLKLTTVCLLVWGFAAQGLCDEWVIENVTIHTVTDKGILIKGSILVRDGKIVEVGEKVTVPLTAKRIDGFGKHVTPGFVGLFYPIESGEATGGETRTVTVGGRTFVVPGRSPAANISFTVLAEKLSLDSIDWAQPSRLGITTTQLIAPGYCQTAIAQPGKDRFTTEYVIPKGQLAISVTNNAQSLDLLRNNLRERTSATPTEAPAGSSRGGFGGLGGRGGRGGDRPGGGPSGGSGGPPAATSSSPAPSAAPAVPVELTPEQKLWKEVRDGERALWVNVNNAATILHVIRILAEAPKAKVVWIANGPDIYLTLNKISKDRSTILLAPQIDLVPNSRNRVNVPAMIIREKVPFAFSFGMRSTEMSRAQASPTFALGILSKMGLTEDQALRAATRLPAELLGLGSQLGTIEAGKRANLILFDGSPFETATEIDSVYLDGRVIYEN
jgi:uncharacterized membrane protein YgcG